MAQYDDYTSNKELKLINLKRCYTCKEVKCIDYFSKRGPSGTRSNCKVCDATYRREHKETINATCRKSYYKNVEHSRELHRINQAKYYHNNHDKCKAMSEMWAEQNKARKLAYNKEWKAQNSKKIAEHARTWKRNNRAKANAFNARRRAFKRRATVVWANYRLVNAFYEEARRLTLETGTPYQVDHIVPLVNDLVCGLHWEGNLQVISREDNIRKSNNFIVG